MRVHELFDRCVELVKAEPSPTVLRYMHETLVLACAEALKGSGQGFGNLMAQTDYLCKQAGIGVADRIAIQAMRRHSNRKDHILTRQDLRYDVRALALFISAVFQEDIPHELVTHIPTIGRPTSLTLPVNQRYLHCVVAYWDEEYIYATTDEGNVCIETEDETLRPLLTEGMQLNLLDCHREGQTVRPKLVVVEPDFLLDISSLAACFSDYGHHPIAYTLGRLKPVANTQPILLGNFAGAALDDIINQSDYTPITTIRNTFREQALQFCTCTEFNPQAFKEEAYRQVANIKEAVVQLLDISRQTSDIKPLLEPSFVCEALGLQGRVDLMTSDKRLLVEQKSGKNWSIERSSACPTPQASHLYAESHYVQLLLYFGILRHNFHLAVDRVDIRLLYSRYPAKQGLLVVNYYQKLFHEAIRLRNRIVAQEIQIARYGFDSIKEQLRADSLNERHVQSPLFERFIRPQTEQILAPLNNLSEKEHTYVERMLTFVYREQLAQKVGTQEGQGGAVANLWNMPLTQKRDTGSIFLGLRIIHKEQSSDYSGYDRLILSIPDRGDDFLPNFRRNDMVYLYAYEDEPSICGAILYKGVIERLTDHEITIRLNDGQQNPEVFEDTTYAVEPSASDMGTTSAIRSIHAFCAADPDRRALLLGQRVPRCDTSLQLSRSYHPFYDDILLKTKQARDYFLLQGPPGTGKTSMALRFLVEEELQETTSHVLLMAYTNRAVDEICGMLEEAGIDYTRLGTETSCAPRYTSHLPDKEICRHPRLETVRQQLKNTRVMVGTTSTMQSRPYLFELQHFSLCVIDEASQILEPHIIGLLASSKIDRFILIGDHKQLPAVVQQPDDIPSLSECRLSLFERLLQNERKAKRTTFTAILQRQGRMHPDIAAFPNRMFYAHEQLQPVPLPHQEEEQLNYLQPSEDTLDDLLKQRRVIFFPSEPCHTIGISDKVNSSEAGIVADLLRRIYRQYGDRFDADKTVGVIVPYRNQIAMIRREIERLNIPVLLDISIDTVERYQGSQRDVIIYSFTIQQPYQLDFLTANCFEEDGKTIDRKLNVAMTRARKQLLMTGNVQVLSANPLFAKLIADYQR
ncbi:MAG: AAA family ATPase [Prevotella sp.]|nr:AAA family ATPase [Prevotella sp.]